MKKVLLILLACLLFVSCINDVPSADPVKPQIHIYNKTGSDAFLEVSKVLIGEYDTIRNRDSYSVYPYILDVYSVSIIEKEKMVYIQNGSYMMETIVGRTPYSFSVDMQKPMVRIDIYDEYVFIEQLNNAWDKDPITSTIQI